jgi:hypothetical protein
LAPTFSTTLYSTEAVRVVTAHDTAQGPLFLYLPFQVTHSPYEIPASYLNKSIDVARATYDAMVNIMDEAVGNLTKAQKEKEMWEDTLFIFSADNGGVYHSNQQGNNWPLRGQKTSSWEGGVRVTAFVWGGVNVIRDASLRGTTNSAFIHIADWYATLCTLVGVDPSDDGHKGDGVPSIDSIDQWSVLMKHSATPADSVRVELPLAFCPPDNGKWTRGSDDCAPTDPAYNHDHSFVEEEVMIQVALVQVGGGPSLPARNGALIQVAKDGKQAWKLMWGAQFGHGVYTGPLAPNGTARVSNDVGCPTGCLYELLSDPTESNDLSEQPKGATIFAAMVKRLSVIGTTQWQTNYSDVTDDADCITDAQMKARYGGWLGPVCGLSHGVVGN